ncbi:MAG: GNAT family N-acetyltransferase [Bacteroidales bacterium]
MQEKVTDIIIKTADTYQDSIIIGDMLANIWNEKVKESDYELIFKYIKLFSEGHIIAEYDYKPIATSIAFPIEKKPSIEEFNQKHPYDFFSKNGKLYYIHVIQVLPEFRNKGIGTKIMIRQIAIAKEKKYNFIVGFSIDKEIDRWEKHGFIKEGKFGEYKSFGVVKWIEMKM